MIKDAIAKVVDREDLTEFEMEQVMEKIMTGAASSAQIGSFITALRCKGETVDEITGAARVMRAKSIKICGNRDRENERQDTVCAGGEILLDTCGTGGDGTNTFNVSTVTAFVAAGAGAKVAKHGNRAVSSRCGSADVLEELGVKLDLNSSDVEKCIREVGIGFLFAPLFHGAMKYAAGPRREIGLRTIFNLLGPLTNPAGATVQVLGLYDPGLTEKIAMVLNKLGTKEALVVCGEGTFDEISICSPTRVSRLKEGNVDTFIVTPEEYGLKRATPDSIKGGDVALNARIIRDILKRETGAKRDMILLNTGAALMVTGKADDIKTGIDMAAESIDSGKALEKLELLIELTNKVTL